MPIDRIEISDYELMGRKVLEWTQDPSTRPTCVDDLKTQLRNIALVPERITSIEFVQSSLDHLVLRLPPAEMAKEGEDRAKSLDRENSQDYEEPLFYRDRVNLDVPRMSNLEFLYSRIGDYTIAQCK